MRIISNCEKILDEVPYLTNDMINVDPDIMLGKPVIAGTRITVELILEKLAAGETIENIIEEYPQLNRNSILAALAYASNALKSIVAYSTEVTSD